MKVYFHYLLYCKCDKCKEWYTVEQTIGQGNLIKNHIVLTMSCPFCWYLNKVSKLCITDLDNKLPKEITVMTPKIVVTKGERDKL